MKYDPSSRARLGPYDLARFTEPTLFHEIARTLCVEACLPRKELFESWEVARRVRRRLRGRRVVDLACGHGLVAQIMLLLDPELESALAVDRRIPASAAKVMAAMAKRWPRLEGKTTIVEARLASVELLPEDLAVSCHACGVLTDRVLDHAIAAHVPVAVLPCCQSEAHCDAGSLDGWIDFSLAVDVTRVARLRANGYRVYTQTIPIEMTAKNRLLIAEPT
jgi:hypothetical protein